MSWISQFLHPGRAYDKAGKAFEQHLSPYEEQGQHAYGQYNGAIEKLLNPQDLYDQFLNNYHMSDVARLGQERAINQGNRAAQSMGLGGSSSALQSIQAGANQIGADDEQRFIDRMIQQYLQGAGMAGNIYNTGAQAAQQLGTNAAQMEYGKNSAGGNMFGNLLGSAIGAAGAAFGGPAGAAIGSQIGKGFGSSGQPGWSVTGQGAPSPMSWGGNFQ